MTRAESREKSKHRVTKEAREEAFRRLAGLEADALTTRKALEEKRYEVFIAGFASMQARYLEAIKASREVFRECGKVAVFEHCMEAVAIAIETLEGE